MRSSEGKKLGWEKWVCIKEGLVNGGVGVIGGN